MQYDSDYKHIIDKKSLIEFGAKFWMDVQEHANQNSRTQIWHLSNDEFVESYKEIFNFTKKELVENIIKSVVEFYASSSQENNLNNDVIEDLFKRFCREVQCEIEWKILCLARHPRNS